MNSNSFFSDLLIQFPEVDFKFNSEDGDHYKMERFADYTIKQIEQKNIGEIKRAFNFIEARLESITSGIENALNVSYCEVLLWYDHYKRGIEMKKVMPRKLLQIYLDYKKNYNSLG